MSACIGLSPAELLGDNEGREPILLDNPDQLVKSFPRRH